MTKKVRIENADGNATVKVVVEVWKTGVNGEPNTMQKRTVIWNASDLVEETIWEGLYVKTYEVPRDKVLE